jgi:ABC-type phosphate transport system substrate-binding protein
VVDFVKNNPGAIGYVSNGTRIDGVKELRVTGN